MHRSGCRPLVAVAVLLVVGVGLPYYLQPYDNTVFNSLLDYRTLDAAETLEYSGHAQHLCPASNRPQYVAASCDTNHSWGQIVNGRNMLVDDEDRIIYCTIPKVAGSTFKALLASSASQTPLSQIVSDNGSKLPFIHKFGYLGNHTIRTFRVYSKPEVEKRLRKYFKFMIVRHPFDRLLSAWRDKMEYVNHGIKIEDPSDEQLERFVDFVTGVANGSLVDRHWAPMASVCGPCRVRYDSILRLESAETDIPFILSKLKVPSENRASSVLSANRMSSLPASEKLRKLRVFYSRVNTEIIERLMEIYREDFHLFGYDWYMRHTEATCSFNDNTEAETRWSSGCC